MADNITSSETIAAEVNPTPVPGISPADIAEAAANPQSFSVEGLSQTNRSVSDLIAADKYLRALRRSRRGGNPFAGMISHAIPPGTCDR